MQYIKPDVATICMGQAASFGAVLLAAGAKGKRSALPHARVMIHQPWGGVQGQVSDIEIHAREMLSLKHKLTDILVHHTGQPFDRIEKDSDRNFFMASNEAKEYGIIDEVIVQKKNTDKKK